MSTTAQQQKRGSEMPLIKVIRNGQVTLPVSIRKVLQVVDGDYLEAEVVDGTVVLRPKAVVDRDGAWRELNKIVSKPKWVGQGPEPSEDELMDMIVDDIHAMRKEHDKSDSR